MCDALATSVTGVEDTDGHVDWLGAGVGGYGCCCALERCGLSSSASPCLTSSSLRKMSSSVDVSHSERGSLPPCGGSQEKNH